MRRLSVWLAADVRGTKVDVGSNFRVEAVALISKRLCAAAAASVKLAQQLEHHQVPIFARQTDSPLCFLSARDAINCGAASREVAIYARKERRRRRRPVRRPSKVLLLFAQKFKSWPPCRLN